MSDNKEKIELPEIGDAKSEISEFLETDDIKPTEEKTYDDYIKEFRTQLYRYSKKYLLEKYNIELNCCYLIKEFSDDGDKYALSDNDGKRNPPQKGESIYFELSEYRIMNAFIYRATSPGNCYNYVRYFYEGNDLHGYYNSTEEFPLAEVTKEIAEKIDEFCSRLVVEKNKEYAKKKIKELQENIEDIRNLYGV